MVCWAYTPHDPFASNGPQVLAGASTQTSNRVRALYRDARRSVQLLHDTNCLQARLDEARSIFIQNLSKSTTAQRPIRLMRVRHLLTPCAHTASADSAQVVALADELDVPLPVAVGAWYASKVPPGSPLRVVVLSDALARDREARSGPARGGGGAERGEFARDRVDPCFCDPRLCSWQFLLAAPRSRFSAVVTDVWRFAAR